MAGLREGRLSAGWGGFGIPVARTPVSRPGRKLGALAVAIALSSRGGPGHAQMPLFYMELPTATLDLGFETDRETRRGPFIDQTKETATARQKLDVRTRGYVYHPALLVYSIGIKPELKQQDTETTGGFAQEDHSSFLGYFVDATVLQLKPYTLNLFASKDRSEFRSSLAPDVATESNLNRGRLLLKYPALPTTVTLESRESRFENFFSSFEKTDAARVESSHKSDASRTSFKAESARQTRRIDASAFTVERDDASIGNSYTPSRGQTLASSARYGRSRSELFDFTLASVSSRLALRHTERFNTYYDVRLDRRDEKDFFSDSRTVSAGLSHLLYENLTTSLGASRTRSEVNTGALDGRGANLSFLYRRRIPWGHLSANLGYGKRIEDDRRAGALTEVRDEALILSGTTPVLLANANVDVSSIVVTDSTGTTIYVENADYVASAVGSAVAIARTPFGAIGDGDQVLADYRYQALPPAKTAVESRSFGFDLSLWSSLRLYYQRNRSEQTLLSGTRSFEPFDDTIERIGGEFGWKWSTTRVEYEDRDTTRTPTERRTIQEVLTLRPSRDLSLGSSADYSELRLKETGDVTESTSVRANLGWRASAAARISLEAFAQRSRGRVQDTERSGVTAVYEWAYGAWQASLRYLFLDERNGLSGDTRERQTLLFQVRREFR